MITPQASRYWTMVQARALTATPPPGLEQTWYSIRNKAGTEGDTAEVFVYGEIGEWGITADQFRRDIDAITAPRITMRVSSPGGDVPIDGVAIYNTIRTHPAHVTAKVDGLAASIASVIVQAADERVMMKHSQMMIHNPWMVWGGDAAEFRRAADLLERQTDVIAGIYHERTRGGQRKLDKILAAMAKDGGAGTWMTAEEAVAFGLADSVETAKFQGGPQAMAGPDEDEDLPDDPDGNDGDDGVDDPMPDGEDPAALVADLEDAPSDSSAIAFAMLNRQLLNLEAKV